MLRFGGRNPASVTVACSSKHSISFNYIIDSANKPQYNSSAYCLQGGFLADEEGRFD